MAKNRSKPAFAVMKKSEFLRPKMEELILDEASGTGCYIREIGGKALLEFSETQAIMQKIPKDDEVAVARAGYEITAKVILMGCCNADGSPYFTADDLEAIENKSPFMLERISQAIYQFNGMTASGEVTDDLKNDLNSASTDT